MSAYVDPFIEYTPELTLPAVVIDSNASFRARGVALSEVRLVNRSPFAYSANITDAPEWLLDSGAPESIAAGAPAVLRVAVDQSALPPGETTAAALLTISGRFVRRSYPLALHAAAHYSGPAPRIETSTTPTPSGGCIFEVAVSNAGGGLLQGFCYDRDTNQRREFLLAGGTETADAQVLRFSKTIRDPHEQRHGVVVVCDCVNDRLRERVVLPKRASRITDAPFIDFLGVQHGQHRTFELRLFPHTGEVTLEVPERLRRYLRGEVLPGGRVQFVLDPEARLPASLTDYVYFHAAAARHALPILISGVSS